MDYVWDLFNGPACHYGRFMEWSTKGIIESETDENTRSNARMLDWSGNEMLTGTITANGINISEAISTVKLRINSGSLQASIDGGTTWHTINFAD